jgi:tellurite resistance protein TerC
MTVQSEKKIHLETNPILTFCRKHIPLTSHFHSHHFLIRQDGQYLFTPLALVLIVVEFTDLLFAVDSIPAIFAITTDPFIVYTSNVCAILGLRSLYFLLAKAMSRFHYLKLGLGLVLAFIGIKMLGEPLYKLPTVAALGIVALILGGSIVASLLRKENRKSETGDRKIKTE